MSQQDTPSHAEKKVVPKTKGLKSSTRIVRKRDTFKVAALGTIFKRNKTTRLFVINSLRHVLTLVQFIRPHVSTEPSKSRDNNLIDSLSYFIHHTRNCKHATQLKSMYLLDLYFHIGWAYLPRTNASPWPQAQRSVIWLVKR